LPLRDKGQLEVVDDAIDHGEIGEESDDLHLATALGAGQGIDLVHLADHLGPAAARDFLALLFHPGEHLSQEAVGKSGKVMEATLSILASLGHQEVDMLSEGLYIQRRTRQRRSELEANFFSSLLRFSITHTSDWVEEPL
jgi:hypothetical protein